MTYPPAIALIPHEQPMVFVDRVQAFDATGATASLLIHPGLMFADAQGLPSWTAIEIMAQTVSVYAGLRGRDCGQPPRIGYLLGTRKLALPVPYFEHGKTLLIHAREHYMHEGLGQFSCEIEYDQHRIAAILSVYQPQPTAEETV